MSHACHARRVASSWSPTPRRVGSARQSLSPLPLPLCIQGKSSLYLPQKDYTCLYLVSDFLIRNRRKQSQEGSKVYKGEDTTRGISLGGESLSHSVSLLVRGLCQVFYLFIQSRLVCDQKPTCDPKETAEETDDHVYMTTGHSVGLVSSSTSYKLDFFHSL